MIIQRHVIDPAMIPNDETILRYVQQIENGFSRLKEGKKLNFYYFKERPLDLSLIHI